MSDLETRLREKIEKKLEERKKARLQENGGGEASGTDEISKQVEASLNEKLAQRSTDTASPEPVDEPIDEPVDEPVDEPIDEPVDEPDNEPIIPAVKVPSPPDEEEKIPSAQEQASQDSDKVTPVAKNTEQSGTSSDDDKVKENESSDKTKVNDPSESKPEPPKKGKKKDALAAFAKSKDGKRKTMPGKKKTKAAQAGKKTKGAATRGPSATRSLSEQEQKLLDEKTRIDAKFKKQKLIAYVSITAGTLLLLIIMVFTLQYIKKKRAGGPAKRQTVIKRSSPSTKKAKVTSVGFESMDELNKAVKRAMSMEKDTSKAVKMLVNHAKNNPDSASECETIVDGIAEDYLESGKGSLLWKNMHTQLTLGKTSNNPEDIVKAIAALREFAFRNTRESFLSDYMIQKLEKRYAKMTGGLLP